jgi:hypothetical protein
MLSCLCRWDFIVTDEQAVVAAGRHAYARTWPSDTEEDAWFAVSDLGGAAMEIVHADDWAGLQRVEGLALSDSWAAYLTHDGDTETDDGDPFSIGRS